MVFGVEWKLSSRPSTTTHLEDIRLIQRSEHSHPGPSDALAGIRIRLSPSDFGDEIRVPPARCRESPSLPNRPGGVA